MPTWATIPSPKKDETRRLVWSKNWSGITMSRGWISSFMLPTALTEMIAVGAERLEPVDVGAVVDAPTA